MNTLAAIALLLPPVCMALALVSRRGGLLLILAPLPLIALGLAGEGAVNPPLLLPGCGFAVDEVSRPLLLLAGVGWALAGAFAAASVKQHARSFAAWWLLTLTGQAMALLALDMGSFYAGYALMSLSAYGLVVHSRSAEALRAGRVYIVLALFGEALILAGMLAIGGAHGNADFAALANVNAGAAHLLLFAGFAVKLGVVPLHVWLPLAHPVAPAPASAILSGLLVKAGLLGMLRFAPPGTLPWPEIIMALGLFTAAYGALVGLTQPRLKTVLAYSTVSQMGIALLAFGMFQSVGAAALPALVLFALHTGMNKIALFIAAGHRMERRWPRLLFVLPAAALAGLPLTTGMLAKSMLKGPMSGAWATALGLSSVLTTVLLLHAYTLARNKQDGRASPHWAWIIAVAAGIALPWGWALARGMELPGLGAAWDGAWPVALGIVIYLFGRRWSMKLLEGDLVAAIEPALAFALKPLKFALKRWADWEPALPRLWLNARHARRIESELSRLPAAGLCLLLILIGLLALL